MLKAFIVVLALSNASVHGRKPSQFTLRMTPVLCSTDTEMEILSGYPSCSEFLPRTMCCEEKVARRSLSC